MDDHTGRIEHPPQRAALEPRHASMARPAEQIDLAGRAGTQLRTPLIDHRPSGGDRERVRARRARRPAHRPTGSARGRPCREGYAATRRWRSRPSTHSKLFAGGDPKVGDRGADRGVVADLDERCRATSGPLTRLPTPAPTRQDHRPDGGAAWIAAPGEPGSRPGNPSALAEAVRRGRHPSSISSPVSSEAVGARRERVAWSSFRCSLVVERLQQPRWPRCARRWRVAVEHPLEEVQHRPASTLASLAPLVQPVDTDGGVFATMPGRHRGEPGRRASCRSSSDPRPKEQIALVERDGALGCRGRPPPWPAHEDP